MCQNTQCSGCSQCFKSMTCCKLSDCMEGWDWTNVKLKFGELGGGSGLRGGVRCWLRSLKTALKALCFQLKHPSRITHTKTYLQPAKSGACYLQRAYKSHLAASGYGISLTHTHSSLISALFSPPLLPPLVPLTLCSCVESKRECPAE